MDGMAKNSLFRVELIEITRSLKIYFDWLHPSTWYPGGEKIIWSKLESNSGLLTPQAADLSTTLLPLGHNLNLA